MARKPKPTALKLLEGNPGKRDLNAHEPDPGHGMPTCPDWLMPEAKEEWNRLAETMNRMGVLTEVDMAAFAGYCQNYAKWKEAEAQILADGAITWTAAGGTRKSPWVAISETCQSKMLQFAGEFGLTPSSRSKIIAGNSTSTTAADDMEALLGVG